MGALRQAWTRFTTWYRQAGKAAQIGVGCGALILVCICASIGLGAIGAINGGAGSTGTQDAHSNSNSNGVAAAHPTATSTTASYPTATVTGLAHSTATPPATSGSPVLGGSGQAFINKYGPLTSQSNTAQGDLHFKQYPGVALDYLIVDVGKYFGITPGDNDAYSITVAPPPDQNWTPTAAKQACVVFLPADAQHLKQVTTIDSTSNMIDGSDDIYTSASLAKTFPASAFQDANQNPAPAGSFDVWYQYTKEGDTSQVAYCQIMIGTQQTKG